MRNLNNKDVQVLTEWGHSTQEIHQIDECISSVEFEYCDTDRRVSMKSVLKGMDRTEFLSGMSRAAFHWTSVRRMKNGREVLFDCGRYLNA